MAEIARASEKMGSWRTRPYHRRWLVNEADRLFDFFQYASFNPAGGFFDLNAAGTPLEPNNPMRFIHTAGRMVHCFAIGSLFGRPGSDEIVDHGMSYIWERHRDPVHGGYFWATDDNGPRDGTKQGYGQAFVLLAAASAKLIGHPLADKMLADVTEIIDTRFWESAHGAIIEEFKPDWTPIAPYRGQNSNMHLTEALMAAFEATGEKAYLDKAEAIADLIINRRARENGFRVAEHFHADWSVDHDYQGSEMFRPSGTTPGHWMEWARLVLQLWVLGGKHRAWMPEASEALFRQAITLGWDQRNGGFFYNLDWNNAPRMPQKLWWPVAEGVGAASFLCEHRPDPFYEHWYRRLWDTITQRFIDHEQGGWHEELNGEMQPSHDLFPGKEDIYHALQACLIPLYPATGSLAHDIIATRGAL